MQYDRNGQPYYPIPGQQVMTASIITAAPQQLYAPLYNAHVVPTPTLNTQCYYPSQFPMFDEASARNAADSYNSYLSRNHPRP